MNSTNRVYILYVDSYMTCFRTLFHECSNISTINHGVLQRKSGATFY